LKHRSGSRYTANSRAAFPKNAVNEINKQNIQAHVLNVSDTSTVGSLAPVVEAGVAIEASLVAVCGVSSTTFYKLLC
jgi:hypothetical protein